MKPGSKICLIAASASLLLGVGGCGNEPMDSAAYSAGRGLSSELWEGGDYRLGRGDKVRVRVFGTDQMGGEFQIDLTGSIDPPLVGVVRAEGLTPAELKAKLVERLRSGRIIDDPQVSVDLVAASPFYVLGEVEKSGEYPYQPGLNVVSAIATAGGFRYRADQHKVMVRRRGQTAEVALPTFSAAPVYPGDIVRVPGRFF